MVGAKETCLRQGWDRARMTLNAIHFSLPTPQIQNHIHPPIYLTVNPTLGKTPAIQRPTASHRETDTHT